jgi:phosphohistidine phosphatase SixA
MKYRLIVMRHAKSSWKDREKTDHERPLNKRGRRDTPRVADRLGKLGWIPQVVISSDSLRTRETAELLERQWPDGPRVEFTGSLYHGGIDELVEEVSAVPGDVQCVLVLGHNPGWEGAVLWLTGEDVRLTTANAALLERKADSWKEALSERGAWKLRDVLRPKDLDD